MSMFENYLASLCRELLKGRALRGTRRLRATLAHAVRFSTWQSLAQQGLKLKAMTDLVCDWIVAAEK